MRAPPLAARPHQSAGRAASATSDRRVELRLADHAPDRDTLRLPANPATRDWPRSQWLDGSSHTCRGVADVRERLLATPPPSRPSAPPTATCAARAARPRARRHGRDSSPALVGRRAAWDVTEAHACGRARRQCHRGAIVEELGRGVAARPGTSPPSASRRPPRARTRSARISVPAPIPTAGIE